MAEETLVLLARYPFLKGSLGFVKEMNVSLEDFFTPSFRSYITSGCTKVARALKFKLDGKSADVDATDPDMRTHNLNMLKIDVLREILTYIAARIGVSVIADPLLVRRFAVYESKMYKARLDKDCKSNEKTLKLVAAELGLDISLEQSLEERRNLEKRILAAGIFGQEAVEKLEKALYISIPDYLKYTGDMRTESEWKLVKQDVACGYVFLSKERLTRVVESILYKKFESELPLSVNDELIKLFKPFLIPVQNALEELKSRYRKEELKGTDAELFPPCIKNLVQKARAGENIVHSGRFALTAFLYKAGMSREEILRLFASSPDFRVDIAKYQINHITGAISGTVYNVPDCRTMVAYGLCVNKDSLCQAEWLSRPLQYYKFRLKKKMSASQSSGRVQKVNYEEVDEDMADVEGDEEHQKDDAHIEVDGTNKNDQKDYQQD